MTNNVVTICSPRYRDVTARVEIREAAERIQSVWQQGWFYEYKMLDFMRERYEDALDLCFIDAGASIGNHTLYFLKAFSCQQVVAIEPFAESRTHLIDNLNINQDIDLARLTLLHYALGANKSSKLRMSGIRVCDDGQVRVDATTLDHIVFGILRLKQVDVLKIDVEDYNTRLLEGARGVLGAYRPDIYIECQTVEDFKEVERFLSMYGYHYTGFVFNATPTYFFSGR